MKANTPHFRKAQVCACGDHGFVGLTRASVALFSPEDVHKIEGRLWRLMRRGGGLRYAACDGGKSPLMHRLIAADANHPVVDHRSRDGLDNRRCNLRPCACQENSRNKAAHRGKALPLKGAYQGHGDKFVARIRAAGRNLHLGSFTTVEAAARAYDEAALRLHGEFARTNAMMGLLPQEALIKGRK